jgi:glutamate N-acetyltransferase/amino-acid N-acetyltransferase
MISSDFRSIDGGVTAAKGFKADGATAGIKASGNRDLGIIFSERDAVSAGAFTTNRIRAACVTENEKLLPSEKIRAILCNSGNANACTGKRGVIDVEKSRQIIANSLNISSDSILVASTGIIGEFLPVDKIEKAVPALVESLSYNGNTNFANAIMTTDTVEKEYAIEVEFSGGVAKIGGTSKGAGMIHPNMATMLGFITTDVSVPQFVLNRLHKECVDRTFNNLTVDGDTSTNDMVLIMANGASDVHIENEADIELLEAALFDVYNVLCAKIAEDGEGATKRIEINVFGGKDSKDCKLTAKAIANSNLVKTAMFGNDPNWGRILCAAGYSGAYFHPEQIKVDLCDTPVYKDGGPAKFDAPTLSEKMSEKVVTVTVDLGEGGDYHAVAHTCDFSYDYVKINAEYHT